MDRSAEVPEISSRETDTVLETAVLRYDERLGERIVAFQGRTYRSIGPDQDMYAFTSLKNVGRPPYVEFGKSVNSFAISRPVMEHQARTMFLETLDPSTERLWPRQPPQHLLRDMFRFETYSKRIDIGRVTGMDESLALQDKALEGVLCIDGEIWAECGKPCIVVHAEQPGSARGLASIGLTTLPRWTERSFRNAYFSLDRIDDANDYRAALTYELGGSAFADQLPEFEAESCVDRSFDADVWEAERLTEAIGTDVLAVSRRMENNGYLTDGQLAAAEAVHAASKQTSHLFGQRISVMEHLESVLAGWETIGHRTAFAECPAPKASLMKLQTNRAILALDSETIAVPVAPWSPAP
jgi:hypothetical protein